MPTEPKSPALLRAAVIGLSFSAAALSGTACGGDAPTCGPDCHTDGEPEQVTEPDVAPTCGPDCHNGEPEADAGTDADAGVDESDGGAELFDAGDVEPDPGPVAPTCGPDCHE